MLINKPRLGRNIIVLRQQFAETVLMMSSEIKKIIAKDESKFSVQHFDERLNVWRTPRVGLELNHLVSIMKGLKPGVMLWACFSSKRAETLVFINKNMDAVKYCSILSDNLQAFRKLFSTKQY